MQIVHDINETFYYTSAVSEARTVQPIQSFDLFEHRVSLNPLVWLINVTIIIFHKNVPFFYEMVFNCHFVVLSCFQSWWFYPHYIPDKFHSESLNFVGFLAPCCPFLNPIGRFLKWGILKSPWFSIHKNDFWLVVWIILSVSIYIYIFIHFLLGIIIPTDEFIIFRGVESTNDRGRLRPEIRPFDTAEKPQERTHHVMRVECKHD